MSLRLRYSQWKDEHRPFLEVLPSKRVFLLFSGGVDSSLAMDFFLRAGKEFGFDIEAHAGAFPVHRYPHEEMDKITSYWRKRGADLVWHQLDETDEGITLAKNPCTYCQGLRKKMLKTLLPEMVSDWTRFVLIAGYSLWDLVSYAIEHILADAFSNPEMGEPAARDKRFLETAQRFHPILTMKEGYTVFRPLIQYNANEIATRVTESGIPTLSIPCTFEKSRPKRILEDYYLKTGQCFDYRRLMSFAEKHLNLPNRSIYTTLKKEAYLRHFF